jgi:hypothetical protein
LLAQRHPSESNFAFELIEQNPQAGPPIKLRDGLVAAGAFTHYFGIRG